MQATLQTRDEVFDMIAHDLKNPLTVIIGTVQLLQRRLQQSEGLPGEAIVSRRLEQVAASAIQMRTMINDLLDLAKLRADQPLELSYERTDLVALLRRAAAEYQHTSSRHRIRIHTSLRELNGMWDASRLERVVANLLSNAIKYSPNGGAVTLRLIRDEREGGAWAVLSVQDEGIGIPETDLPHIFERFSRGRNAGGRIGGSGVGLTSASSIVEQHGGSIAVESAEGHGSTFTVSLPIR